MYSSNTTTLLRNFTASKPFSVHISSSSISTFHHNYPKPQPPSSCRFLITRPRSTTNNSENSSTSRDDNNSNRYQPRKPAPSIEDEEVEIKLRRGGSRKKVQRRRLDQETFLADELARVEIREREDKKKKEKMAREMSQQQTPKKKWDEMTFNEKALELYVGEKGALYWLNKFAYASIYIIIGGWIVFRFVGPALNLYQLDAPPLPPAKLFKE